MDFFNAAGHEITSQGQSHHEERHEKANPLVGVTVQGLKRKNQENAHRGTKESRCHHDPKDRASSHGFAGDFPPDVSAEET